MKKILFVIESLSCAGAEKSLVNLINSLDLKEYDIDLQLFSGGGELEHLLPSELSVLEIPEFFIQSKMSILRLIRSIKNYKFLIARLRYSLKLRIGKRKNSSDAIKLWKSIKKIVAPSKTHYDLAIAYSHGLPTYYVMDKIEADQKACWINVNIDLMKSEIRFQSSYYSSYNKIICVSDIVKSTVCSYFPSLSNKVNVIYDGVDCKSVIEHSKGNIPLEYNQALLNILTIGRLSYEKGIDLAIDACKQLKENKVKFRWYILGKGALEDELTKKVKDLDLVNEFVFLGVRSNPYPYIRSCDIYVQPSLHEGFGMALAEAKCLKRPIVTTNFPLAYLHVDDKQNGLVVEKTPYSLFNGILEVIENIKANKYINYYDSKSCMQDGRNFDFDELFKFGVCNEKST